MTERGDFRTARVPAVLGIVFAGLYAWLSLLRFDRFEFSSWDNAIFEQAVKGYAHLGAPTVDVKAPDFNQLGDHFSPILALIAPFYRVFPSAETILIAQALLLGLSVAIIARAGIKHLGRGRGICLGVAYGLSFGIQSAVQVDFHEVAFAAPLLALAGAAWLDRDWRRVMWWTLPLLLVKEDMGLTVAAVGAVMWFGGDRRRGTGMMVGGITAMALIIYVVIPIFSPTGEWQYGSSFGNGRGFLTVLFDDSGQKLVTLLVTFGVTGMLALLSPWTLLALPVLAVRFSADKEFYWGTDFHYSLVLMPIVFIGLIDVMTREHRPAWLRAYAPQGVTIALAIAAAMQLSSPLSVLVKPESYDAAPRAAAAREAIALVPKGATVETDISLMSHLVSAHRVYWLGSVGSGKPAYVLFDAAGGLGSPTDAVAYAETTHGGSWKLLFDEDGYQLAARQ